MGNEEAGETAKEGGGRLCLLLPLVSFHKPMRWFTPPRSGSIVLPPVVGGGKFLFKWGWWYSPCRPFLSILNGGSCIRHPRFFLFQTGAVVFTLPPISFHFKWGQRVAFTLPPNSLLFRMGGQCESHSLPPILFHFKRGRCESHTLPRFLFVCPL